MKTRKYALGIEYNGSAYCGWQQQKHCESVQQHLQQAIGFVADHTLLLSCAGRTDAGVHAVEQVAHFKTTAERENRAWVLGSNCRLPRDIRIKWINEVDESFHARFSAVARSYRYIILNKAVPSAIFHDKTSWEFRPLDHEEMHECAQLLLGEHDFSAFRATGCQAKSANRNVHSIDIGRNGDLIYLDIKANAFLYHMVRNIAGSLMTVGRGEQSSEWFAEVLAKKDRNLADATAPADGLYLVRPYYPEQFNLPIQGQKPVLF
ncbi:MAG: tRNA pseudouridine(38-40) synthase TruA [Gammaproteobacteria bacterium]|nr:tRNA pseudouridine(38-40) synthase TruA [Gammaproteobacteria bacterium]